jgi:hypothetical protein
MQDNVKHKKTNRRLTVISRRRAWDADVMANVFAAYVLHRLHEQDGQAAPVDSSPDDGAPAC